MDDETNPALDTEVSNFVALCRAQYAHRLSEEQLPKLEQSVRNLRRTAAELAEFELGNADEPTARFQAGTEA